MSENCEEYYRNKLQLFIQQYRRSIFDVELLRNVCLKKLNKLLENKIYYEGERKSEELLKFQVDEIEVEEKSLEIHNTKMKELESKIDVILELMETKIRI